MGRCARILALCIIGMIAGRGFVSAQTMQAPYVPRPVFGVPTAADAIGQSAQDEKAAIKKKDDGDDKDDANGNGKTNGDDKKDEPTWYSAHGQATVISQGNWMFHSPYSGVNSFQSKQDMQTSATTTLYLAARTWTGGELIFNPEAAGGTGVGNVFGLGDAPNGEISRVGRPQPTPYVARLFVRQTIGLGGEEEKVEDAANWVAGTRDVNRFTIALGKMPATDSFDNNRYSDWRTKFMNWGLGYNVAWDYPANVRGYNYGFSIDYNEKWWAVRYGVFAEPSVANGAHFDPHFLKANGHILEFEKRYELAENQPGSLKLGLYANLADMGNYRDALILSPVNPDVTLTRSYRIKYGVLLNWQQQFSDTLGAFARAGWNDGRTETWAYTEADVSGSLGIVINGKSWRRARDEVGVAFIVSGLSPSHRDYLAAGGLGFELGDGKLNYGLENAFETYYRLEFKTGLYATLDYQLISNPGYNKDRGPISLLAIRVHFEF